MKSFKTLCVFVSVILAVCASEATEEPQRRIRGLRSAPKTRKGKKGGSDTPGDTSAPKTRKGKKGGSDAPGDTSAPKTSKGKKGGSGKKG
eukprot:3902753-Ditylum_brightwellii.AAC.1